jgi:ribosome maturation factor RimP
MSLESDIKSIVESVGASLYDTVVTSEFGETIFRVSVTEQGSKSISLDKCVEISHLLSPLLDVTSPVGGEYRLEVSSPGIERKLIKPEHFKSSIGEKVSITTKAKEKYKGSLKSANNESIIVDVDGEEITINQNEIVKARTYFEW